MGSVLGTGSGDLDQSIGKPDGSVSCLKNVGQGVVRQRLHSEAVLYCFGWMKAEQSFVGVLDRVAHVFDGFAVPIGWQEPPIQPALRGKPTCMKDGRRLSVMHSSIALTARKRADSCS